MSRQKSREYFYLVMAAVAAVASVWGQGVLVASPAEQPNCTTNVCKNIEYYYGCSQKSGYQYVSKDCLSCRQAVGRCNTTSTATCSQRFVSQEVGTVSVNEECQCDQIGDGGPANARAVEATSTATASSFVDAGRKLYTCD